MHLGSKVVMVDCHQGDTGNDEENITDYIPTNRIDVLILTHAHYDHFNGIQTLIDNDIEVGEVWESNYQRRYNDNSVAYEEWQDYQNLVSKLNATIYYPIRSIEDYDTVGGAKFQFYGSVLPCYVVYMLAL